MTWDGASYIMEHHVDGSSNVRMLRLKRTGKNSSPISQAEQFKMTLGTTEHYQEEMGRVETITVTTVPDAEAWIAAREAEGGPIDHSDEEPAQAPQEPQAGRSPLVPLPHKRSG